ncbi:acyl-CoA N-acyltransferase [Thelonectria olida]|uniref:Acyl-CoA N-acyltransferase n=1 Tax=Thelonectria olida TaxID=1576542 RepID=A0A9P8WE45_9HYPO|nr:acyl-CoA N-acyltransferase [Thelonectria olida]
MAPSDILTSPSPPSPEPGTFLFETDRLIIRRYALSDAPALAAAGNDPLVVFNLTHRFPHPYTLADAEAFLTESCRPERPDPHYPVNNGVFLKPNTPANPSDEPVFIGGLGLKIEKDVLYRTWEVAYWFASAHWRKGYASEAMTAFVRYLFTTWPALNRLEGTAFSRNLGSQGVMKKAGFVEEGRRKDAVEKNGVIMDLVTLRLLRSEFEKTVETS